MIKVITAALARETSKNINNDIYQKSLERINKDITAACFNGETKVWHYSPVSPVVLVYLEGLGYKIKSHYDQREGDMVEISW